MTKAAVLSDKNVPLYMRLHICFGSIVLARVCRHINSITVGTKAEVKSVCIGVETGRCNTRTFFSISNSGRPQSKTKHPWNYFRLKLMHSQYICQDIKFLASVFGFAELVYGPFGQSNATYTQFRPDQSSRNWLYQSYGNTSCRLLKWGVQN